MKTREKKGYLFSLCLGLGTFCFLSLLINPKFAVAAFQIPEFYYYYSEKIYLNLSTEMITVCFKESVSEGEKEALIRDEPVLKDVFDETLPSGLVLAVAKEGLGKEDITQAIERLNKLPGIKYCTPVFEYRSLKLILMDEFAVRFKPDMTQEDIETLNKENGVGTVRKSPYRRNRYVLRVIDPKDTTAMEMANTYNENPRTLYGTPNFLVMGGYQNTYPDDTYFDEQWALDNTGQVPPGGSDDADIDAPEGWDVSTGSSDIVIAIIDSGTEIDHEDLEAKIWVNTGEIPDNDVDDDENGYVDDVYGWDFEYDNNDPRPGNGPETQQNPHGTACAGLAAAETDNEKGVAGVCWGSKIMPLAIGTAGPITSAATDAIDYASANGADVLSNSWSVPPDAGLTEAITGAKNNGRGGKGCIIVFASGNNYGAVRYPATLSETIAVGATDEDDIRWNYSNYGDELDVVAPSGDGLSTIFWTTDITGSGGYNDGDPDEGDPAGHYTKWFSGTSAATPEVAGLAGLILSVNPELTADEAQFIIEDTADDKGDPGWDQYYGWGRINNESALLEAEEFPTDDELVGWWKLDETSGVTAPDSSGYDNDGTLADSPYDPAWVNDPERGWCLDFDANAEEEDYVFLFPIGSLVTDTVTISAWIYADNLTNDYNSILIQYHSLNGYYFSVHNYKPSLYLNGPEVQSEDSINEDDWYHLAGTYDGFNLKIYVDGAEKGTQELVGEKGINYYAYIGWNFDGKINDVRVYNYALDMFEIWDAMSGDAPRFRIKNSSDETVAWFDSFGNLFLKGSLEENSDFDPPTGHDEFKVQDSLGEDVAIIDTSNGNMYITGEKHEDQNMSLLSPEGFVVKNSDGDVVAYIDDSGDESGHLYLAGKLYQNPE